jgi:AraC-like DNA-binding protein
MRNTVKRTVIHGPTPEALVRVHFVRHVLLEEWKLDQMSAPFWRCYCALEPGGAILFGRRTYALRPGQVMLIPPNTACASTHTRPFRKVFAHFSFVVSRVVAAPGVYTAPLPSLDMMEICRLTAPGVVAADLDFRLTLALLRAIAVGLAAMPADALTNTASHTPLIATAIELMQRDYRRPLGNAAIAQELGMHPNSFVRLFTRQTGTAPQSYYRQIRLEHACRLLIQTAPSIDEVAAACGFWDRNHFTRAFTRQWHCPPAEWRRRNR